MCTSFLRTLFPFYISFFYYSLFDIAGFSTEVHPYLKELPSVRSKGKRVMLVMNLLQSLLGRAVQLEFHHIDKLVSLQDKVNASFARMIFHLGIEADKLEYDEKHILVMQVPVRGSLRR